MNPQNKEYPHHPLLCQESPWNQNTNTIWLGSTIVLNRNLEKFKFPAKLPADKRQQITALLTRDLLASGQLKHPKAIRAEEMPPIEKEFLMEHFLSQQSLQEAHVGEAFVLDETGEFLAVLNLRDHLLLQWTDPREELELAWDRLVKIETDINKSVNFAFSPKFGFLTSDPTQCGTGLIVYIFLHLPTLLYTGRLEEILKKNKDDGIEQTGLQGNPTDLVGDIVVFHNNYTLGLTEENILSSLRTLATKLVVEEKGMRQHLKQESEAKQAEMKDRISRAYAILLHSYQIEAVEALKAISSIKLGMDLGWVQGTTQSALNHLLFSSRRAHLLCHYGQKINQEELPHRRAEFIHKALKGLELLI
jgi:protein arginine kinase